jgi:hypothetical protein
MAGAWWAVLPALAPIGPKTVVTAAAGMAPLIALCFMIPPIVPFVPLVRAATFSRLPQGALSSARLKDACSAWVSCTARLIVPAQSALPCCPCARMGDDRG